MGNAIIYISSEWSIIYFVSFWFFVVNVVHNLVVSFVLDAFFVQFEKDSMGVTEEEEIERKQSVKLNHVVKESIETSTSKSTL